MSITKLAKAKLSNQVLSNLHPKMSQSAKSSLQYLERLASTKDKLQALKGMVKKGDLSKNELGSYAKKLRQNLSASEALVDAFAASTREAKEMIVRKQAAQMKGLLDDSAAVLVSQAYKQASTKDKAAGLRDPKVLSALSTAGSFISGVSDETLATALNTYFKSSETPLGIQMEALEADEAVLSAISKDITSGENTSFELELDRAIEASDEISKLAAFEEDAAL